MTPVSEWVRTVLQHASGGVRVGGDLPLADFQADAANRLVEIVERWGGALLADDVGLGKTRVALTVAKVVASRLRRHGVRGPILCVVPSRTRAQWRQAAARLGIPEANLHLVTHAAMSRRRVASGTTPAFVIVDEAHRFRNRSSNRRKNLVEDLSAPVLLVTATPVVNSADDLRSLFEIFLESADVKALVGFDLQTAFQRAGEGFFDLTELIAELAVRRVAPPDGAGFGRRPRSVLEIVTYEPGDEELWMWRNLDLVVGELSLAALGDSWPRALFIEHVLRLWEAGPDALADAVNELLDFHDRWLEAQRHGRTLHRAEFRSLFGATPGQTVFPFLFADGEKGPENDVRNAVVADRAVLAEIGERLEALRSNNEGRTRLIAELARSGEKLLVFTSYRRAARGLYDRLRDALGSSARVGLVTGDGARATGLGRASADEIVRRFAPGAHGVTLRAHETLDVLVATDCLAEGVNLQDCGRVVLADLPYTPVAVQQRVGRLVRPGGPHDTVTVYLPRPRPWNDSLGMKRRLDAKLREARRVSMTPNSVLDSAPSAENPLALLDALDRLARTIGAPTVPVTPGSWALVDNPDTWLVLAEIDVDSRPRPWLFAIDHRGTPIGLAKVLALLSDLAFDESQIHETALAPEVARAVATRRNFLESARLAPDALDLASPEVRAWNLLRHANLDTAELDDLRPRLLRRHPVATRRTLQRLTDADDAGALTQLVASLAARGATPVRVSVRWALGLAKG